MSALGRLVWGGLNMGPGSQYAVAGLTGMDDMPEVRAADVPKVNADGDYSGADYTGARIIELDLLLLGADPTDLGALVTALRMAVQKGSVQQLQFTDLGVMVYAKVRRRNIPYDASRLAAKGTAHLQFYCANPYVLSLALRQAGPVAAYAPAAGRTYPRLHPWVYGSGGGSGSLSAVNAGGSQTYPVLRIDGPAVQPIIQLSETGAIFQLNNTLVPGEFVLIDTSIRSVLDMGTTPRRDWVVPGSDWPVMQPGVNTFVYRASPYGDGSLPTYLTVTWRDATL